MALLSRYLTPERVAFLRSRTREGAIRELVARLSRTTPGLDGEEVTAALHEREKLVSSWIAPGIAIPHARLAGPWSGIAVAVGRSREGVAWESGDGNPVNLLILIASDDKDPDTHLKLLAEIARTLRDLALKQLILTARSPAEVYRLLITHGYGEAEGKSRSAKIRLSRLLFAHALSVAEEVKARAVVLHGDAVGSLRFMEDIPIQVPVILATVDPARWRELPSTIAETLPVPFPTLSRRNRVELALLFGLSRGVLSRGDTVVSLSGMPNAGSLDTLLVLDVGRELPALFSSRAVGAPLGDVAPPVLEKVLQLSVDIAKEGREGRPVGTIFVVGDHEKVAAASRQMVINPFRGYLDEEKNILDPSLEETVKEFSTLDGAFIVRGDGVIVSAGAFLKSGRGANLPSGFGARHAAAASITAVTASLAIVVSQSTGAVSMFRCGALVVALDRSRGTTERSRGLIITP